MSDLIWLLVPLATAVGCAFAAKLGIALHVLDHPDGGRKRHDRPTPLVGGILVVGPWTVAVGASWFLGSVPAAVAILALAVFATTLIGFVDDRLRLAPGVRLAAAIAVAVAVVAVEPAFGLRAFIAAHFKAPDGVDIGFGTLLAVLSLVGLINAVNMSDGLNGLVAGLWLIWTAGALLFAPPALVPPLVGLIAAIAVVLAFNWYGRLFLGDAGAYAAAAASGLTALLLYNDRSVVGFEATVAFTWFLVPVLDCLRLIVLRLRSGRSPFAPDREHLHHRLQHHLGTRWAVLAYWLMVAVPSAFTLFPATRGFWPVVLSVLVYLAVLRAAGRPTPETGMPKPPLDTRCAGAND